MDALEATTKIIESLAWPSIVAGSAFAFRIQIGKMIDRVKSVKAGPLDFALDSALVEKVEEIREAAQKLSGATPEVPVAQQAGEVTPVIDTSTLNAAVHELSTLLRIKQSLSQQLTYRGLTAGRQEILKRIFDVVQPELVRDMSVAQLQAAWPRLARETSLNGGGATALRSVGILDQQNGLTDLGASIINILSREVILTRSLQ